MPFKTILVCLNQWDRIDVLLHMVATIGATDDAHVIGLYVVPAARIYPALGAGMAAQVTDRYPEFARAQSEGVKEQFDSYLRKQTMPSEWRRVDSRSPEIAETVIEHGHEADLVVVSQINPDSETGIELEFAERVVMEVGRPVLIVPAFGDFNECGRRVLVGWNATREAARAAFDAVPILNRADSVHVVCVSHQETLERSKLRPGVELAAALARHGANVTADELSGSQIDVGNALLSRASDLGSDLLVMGAYGHSRMREYVFGGATRTILQSMTVPVLMSH